MLFNKRLLLVFIALVFIGHLLFVGDAKAEKINNYFVDIKINKDSTIDVVEKIEYNFGDIQKHGIFRHIPIKYTTTNGSRRSIKIKDIEVSFDGVSVDFEKNKNNKTLTIKIGDDNKFVTDKHTYIISYTVFGAINYFDNHDELYWNTTGNDWPVNIQNLFINVEAFNLTDISTFKGFYGGTTPCNTTNKTDVAVSFDCQKLDAGEGATIVIGLKQGVVYKPSLLIKIWKIMLDNWVLFLPIPVFIYMFREWLIKGRDPEGRGTIIPYYTIVDNLSLGEASYITHGKLPTKDLSAMIIQLAIKGFIKIKQTREKSTFKKAEYTFYKLNEPTNTPSNYSLTSEELLLFKGLFSVGNDKSVNTKGLKNSFYSHIPKIKKVLMDKALLNKYLIGSPGKIIMKWVVIAFLVAFFVILSSVFFGILAIISGIIIFIIILGFGIFMPSYTKKGVLAKEKLLGFKLYLKTAEKDRIKFHNAPENFFKEAKNFEKFLPFAMVFGVEKEWAEQFKDIYNSEPDWYNNTSGQAFNSVALVSNLSSFSSITSSSLSSSPSSASSGGSGFSGGGSGGGMGGGGGGSW